MPYHLHSYQITQLIPLFEDRRPDIIQNYVDYCFESIDFINSLQMEESEFEKLWASMVSEEFKLPYDEIIGLYQEDDPHFSDRRVR